MKMKQTVVVKGKQRWDMPSENGGANIRGGKIFVFDGETLADPNKVGEFHTSFPITYEEFEKFHQVPGTYELDMAMKVGSKGQFSVNGVRYVGPEGGKQ